MALLNWRDSAHWSGTDKPCVICHKPTPLLSDRGKPVHKVCAEQWIEDHPGTDTGKPAQRRR